MWYFSADTAIDVQGQSFPGSRGKSKALAFSPTLREKEPQRRWEELDFFLKTLPSGMAWGTFYRSCNVSFGWFNFAASFIMCKPCGYMGRGGERVTVKLLEWLANTNYILVVKGWPTLQHQKPLLFQALTRYHFAKHFTHILGFPCGSASKEAACNAVDLGSIPGLGRSLGEGKGKGHYSGLENSKESDRTERLTLHLHTLSHSLIDKQGRWNSE